MGKYSVELDIDKMSPVFENKKSLAKWVKVSLDDDMWKNGVILVDGTVKYFIDNPALFYKLMETE